MSKCNQVKALAEVDRLVERARLANTSPSPSVADTKGRPIYDSKLLHEYSDNAKECSQLFFDTY